MENLITIVMPACNASKYISEAIDSILNQTFSQFELLIINDGSTDGTENIILSYKDTRIKYVKNEINIGLKATLNKAINITDTKYFARMDADDISLPERIKTQFDFMEANPSIGVCSSWCQFFGTEQTKFMLPLNDADIKVSCLFGFGIAHPAVIIRTDVLKKNNITYGVPFEWADGMGHKILELEDLALWHKLKFVTKFANINQYLLKYRVEGQNLTSKRLDIILERKKEFYRMILKEINMVPENMPLLLHLKPNYIADATSAKVLIDYKNFFADIIKHNKAAKVYDEAALEKLVNQRWKTMFYFVVDHKYKYIWQYIKLSKGLTTEQYIYLLKFRINKFLGRNKKS